MSGPQLVYLGYCREVAALEADCGCLGYATPDGSDLFPIHTDNSPWLAAESLRPAPGGAFLGGWFAFAAVVAISLTVLALLR